MVKGSTPTFTITLPFETNELASLSASFAQEGRTVAVIPHERMFLEGNIASFTLTEEESLSFISGAVAELQLKAEALSGDVVISKIKKLPVYKRNPELFS